MVEDSEMQEANYSDKKSFKLCFLHNCAALISVIAVFVVWSRGRRSRPKIVSSPLTQSGLQQSPGYHPLLLKGYQCSERVLNLQTRTALAIYHFSVVGIFREELSLFKIMVYQMLRQKCMSFLQLSNVEAKNVTHFKEIIIISNKHI